jgi:TolB-like protein
MIATDAIALAPFDNLSGDPGEDRLALGFVEDLAAELSRFGTFEVLYPRTVEAFMRGTGSTAEFQAALKAAHVLERAAHRRGYSHRRPTRRADIWPSTVGESVRRNRRTAASRAG